MALVSSAPRVGDDAPRGKPGPFSYRWPVKPFARQHPVRGFFGDPRIANHGESRQFHFGIDISAPNGTRVYATLSGTAYIHSLHSTTVEIVGEDGVEFSYWHVIPTVRSGQRIVAYETVIGRIEEPYGHVHFSEKRGDRYVNPLRPGAMGPFVDDTTPSVRSVVARDDMLVAEAYDETPLAVPRPWHDLPVMPALVRWRLLDTDGRVVRGWSTAVDFRLTIPHASEFDDRWAPGTMQNHVRAPGRYRLALARDLRGGRYVVEVAASDTRGNASKQRFPLDLSSS
jgi:Peptidase family M23